MSNSDLMKAFFDSSDAFLYVKDADGRFLYMNRAGAAALGLSEAECIGKTAYDVIPKDQADEETRLDRQARVKPITITKLVSLPGGERTLYDHKFPISLPDRPGVGVGGIVLDVTDVQSGPRLIIEPES
jgi:PAS domain S-box-containing protein